jgi:tRNA threonylcarbamoyladenosine biosynthesis protein TsaB
MRILAVDTTTARGSVALLQDDDVVGEIRLLAPDTHSTQVLPAAAFLLQSRGVSPRDIDGFAVATGPGAFTGLRVGLSTVQGLALGADRPCVGVSALDALATRIAGAAETLVAMMDAYRDEVYAGLYDSGARPVSPPVLAPPAEILKAVPAGAAFIGDGALRYRDLIVAQRPDAVFPERSLYLAASLGRLALARFAAGEGTSPDALRPLYLRGAYVQPPRA